MADAFELGREVVERCRALGFAAAGVCEARPSERGAELARWLAQGRHGEMGWLAQTAEARLDPAREMAGVRSVIMVADRYAERPAAKKTVAAGGQAISEEDRDAGPTGRIARYARGRDYHVVIKRRLHELADELRRRFAGAAFRSFVDTAPVMEREHAARAGLGWVGKHTLVIHPRIGSYVLLGGVLTTLELRPAEERVADRCGTCTRCIDACPTGAITPYSVDARRCISYLTIEREGTIEPGLAAQMGEWVFGCDVCQEVCPHNSGRRELAMGTGAGAIRAEYSPRREGFDLVELMGWDEQDRRGALTASSMKRATLAMLKRNAVIAAGNWAARMRASGQGGSDRVRRVMRAIEDVRWSPREPGMVRETAAWVLRRES